MAAGQQPTFDLLNGQLTACALRLRQVMLDITDLHLQVSKLGASGLQALPDAPPVAQASQDLATAWDHIATPAALYFGTADQPDPFNFDDQLATARAGQV